MYKQNKKYKQSKIRKGEKILYKTKSYRMWDNWLYFHNGKHYLFHLSGEPKKKIWDLYGKVRDCK